MNENTMCLVDMFVSSLVSFHLGNGSWFLIKPQQSVVSLPTLLNIRQ
ncbi:Uncharacterized protein APZ42_012826 [Daphnia magna]|uniref:Uncharacterized protein n=1 Tax=Daphnia magna TaxID=35525 RepID=A0A162RD80_9CRUS|nr:Uncharacterized protein APZ42_012826 [Daphnia magna]